MFFWGEGKTGVPGEKPLGAEKRTNNKLNPHIASSSRIDPSHIGGRRVLSTLRHPCSPNLYKLMHLLCCYWQAQQKWILVSFKKPYTCTVVKISLISNCLFLGLVLLQSNWQLLGRHEFNREYNKSSWCHSLFRCVGLAGCVLLLLHSCSFVLLIFVLLWKSLLWKHSWCPFHSLQ